MPSVPSVVQSLPTSSASTSDSTSISSAIQQQNLLSSTSTLESANNSTDDLSIENSTVDDGSEVVYSSEIPASSTEEAQRCIVMGKRTVERNCLMLGIFYFSDFSTANFP